MSGKEEKSIQHRLMDKIDYKAMPPEKGQRAAMRAKQGRPVAAADQNPPRPSRLPQKNRKIQGSRG